MSSWGDTVKLKVTGFEKTEGDLEYETPNLSYEASWEEYYPQTDFTWLEWCIENKERNTTTIFKKCYYTVITALMNNLKTILVDGRNAPYEDCFKGHYLYKEPRIYTESYVVEEIDNKTGDVLFHKEIDAVPNIIHNVHEWEKKHLKRTAVITNKEKMLELMTINPLFYELCDSSLKEDNELALKAVEGNGINYTHILEKFKCEKSFQLAAFISNSSAFHYLPKETQHDYEFLLSACRKNKNCLSYVDDNETKEKIKKELGIYTEMHKQQFLENAGSIDDDLPF